MHVGRSRRLQKHWLYDNLKGDERRSFFISVVEAALSYSGKFVVCINDNGNNTATEANDHEKDTLTLCLERFSNSLAQSESGLAFLAKPSGGPSDEKELLDHCIELRKAGTQYVKFQSLGMNVITLPFGHSRLMQLADLIVSSTLALVAGNERYAKPIFETAKSGFLEDRGGCKGGSGLKIHPSFIYENLYYWILGEEHVYPEGYVLPNKERPFLRDSQKRS